MSLLFWTAIFIFSVAVLIKSANWFVKGAENIGLALKMSPFLIGATIVAAGTSLPELASSLAAVMKGETNLVVANIVGSNITNTFLVLGAAAVFAGGLKLGHSFSLTELVLLVAGSVLLATVSWDGIVGTAGGFLLFISFVSYTLARVAAGGFQTYMSDTREQELISTAPSQFSQSMVLLGLGILGLILGAHYCVESMISLARLLNIPGTFIAITALAIGTSLPELVVSISAALKKKEEIAVGNIVGSNIFNALFIVGFSALFKNLQVDMLTRKIGLPFLFLSAIMIIGPWFKGVITKRLGIVYLLIFLVFLTLLAGFMN